MAHSPTEALPESYRHLNEFAVRFSAGATIYEAGAVPDHFYVVLSGRVRLEASDASGARTVVGEASRAQLIGHLAALAARPAATGATAVDDTVLIAVPVARATEAFASSPDLALAVIRDLAIRVPHDPASEIPQQEPAASALTSEEAQPHEAGSTDGESASSDREAPEADQSPDGGWSSSVTTLSGAFDESFFFKDTTECPVCESAFEYLRVRTAGVRPAQRDSDFHVSYRSEDPTHYGIVVCPTCSYAATHDDFTTLAEKERTAIEAGRQARGRFDYPNLGGARSLDDTVIASDLAQSCYAVRAPNHRRHATLCHRRAWIERERGDAEAERSWLTQARDAYRRSFELDGAMSEEAAMRVAYLIGDLSLRLEEPLLGAQWLETATRFPAAKQQTGLERQARDRLADARKLLSALDAEQQSA